MHIQSYIQCDDSCSQAVPLYVGVVDSSVVQVMAESCNHQSQDLHIAQVILSGDGRVDEVRGKDGGGGGHNGSWLTDDNLLPQSNQTKAS